VERIVEVPVERIVERIVEKILPVEVDKIVYVDRIVEVHSVVLDVPAAPDNTNHEAHPD